MHDRPADSRATEHRNAARDVAGAARVAAWRSYLDRAFTGKLAVIAIVLTALLYNRWLFDSRLFFHADDWTWLWRAEFVPWTSPEFSILPTLVYNDRPVGGALIKALYKGFRFAYAPYQITLLLLHVLNCVLLYRFAVRYAGRTGALLAALLAAVWFSANTAVMWVAAIFDTAGATLCLASLRFRQRAIGADKPLRYDVAGAFCYLLAIRTKEFAIGLIVLLFLMNVLLERQHFRAACKSLWPYLAVFVVLTARYAQLWATAPPGEDSAYRLTLNFAQLGEAIAYYVGTLFYAESERDLAVVAALIVALCIAALAIADKLQRLVLFGIAGFVVMLGPTLFLSSHLQELYLYAPHFFLALSIGGVVADLTVFPALAGLAVTVALLAAPFWIHPRDYQMAFYLSNGERMQAQFVSAVKLLRPLPRGATVVIEGVTPFLNPFYNPVNDSLMTAFHDRTLTVVVEKPETELRERFCAAKEPKRYLRFVGAEAADITGAMQTSCEHG